MQQLREHGIAGVLARVLGLEPDFIGLDVDQPLGVALEAQGLDVGVFDVFFAFGGLQLGVQAHDRFLQRMGLRGAVAEAAAIVTELASANA
ncbi:MAG TPA: hypothetical protein PKN26_08230 [Giesbergeria sp.]|nr:hypothetical protein [Giesbergeria sp.]